jgi:tetratricopeptide (TPR) repeat protein
MSDRQRHVPQVDPQHRSRDQAGDADDPDRESRVEQLLLAGLDQYFAGRFEQAIDIWTRVAFLDRRNSRAKAYIDRARGLVAERQREIEALVHEGVAAYHAGELTKARALLTKVINRGAQSDTAQLFLDRLQRVETPAVLPPVVARPAGRDSARRDPSAAWNWTITLATAVVLAGAILIGARPLASFIAELPITGPPASPAPVDPLPVGRASDRILAQARALRADGRGREALRLLETVDIADAQRTAADALRADIQQEILGAPGAVEGRR